jgi:hypothetical protein
MTKTWRLPEYSPEKAIHCPSGDIFGNSSRPLCEVRRRASPPVELTVQISPAYTNAMRFLFISGNLSKRASSIAAALFDTLSARIRVEKMKIIRFMVVISD